MQNQHYYHRYLLTHFYFLIDLFSFFLEEISLSPVARGLPFRAEEHILHVRAFEGDA